MPTVFSVEQSCERESAIHSLLITVKFIDNPSEHSAGFEGIIFRQHSPTRPQVALQFSVVGITITDLLAELQNLEDRIEVNERRIHEHAKKSETCQWLLSVLGVRPIIATAIEAAVVDPSHRQEWSKLLRKP